MAWKPEHWGAAPQPVGTIGELLGAYSLILYCPACNHSCRPELRELARVHGYGLRLAELLRRARCSACRHRHADLRLHPLTAPRMDTTMQSRASGTQRP